MQMALVTRVASERACQAMPCQQPKPVQYLQRTQRKQQLKISFAPIIQARTISSREIRFCSLSARPNPMARGFSRLSRLRAALYPRPGLRPDFWTVSIPMPWAVLARPDISLHLSLSLCITIPHSMLVARMSSGIAAALLLVLQRRRLATRSEQGERRQARVNLIAGSSKGD